MRRADYQKIMKEEQEQELENYNFALTRSTHYVFAFVFDHCLVSLSRNFNFDVVDRIFSFFLLLVHLIRFIAVVCRSSSTVTVVIVLLCCAVVQKTFLTLF